VFFFRVFNSQILGLRKLNVSYKVIGFEFGEKIAAMQNNVVELSYYGLSMQNLVPAERRFERD
jgi:hypothetical protein